MWGHPKDSECESVIHMPSALYVPLNSGSRKVNCDCFTGNAQALHLYTNSSHIVFFFFPFVVVVFPFKYI